MSHFHVPSRFVDRDETDRDVVGLDDIPDILAMYLDQMAMRYRGTELEELLLAEADALRATVI